MNKTLKYTKVGSIYNVDLGPKQDHRIAKYRPCIVVDNDRSIVSVFAFTSDHGGPLEDSEIAVPKGMGNLKNNSKLKLGQPISIDRCKIENYIGELPDEYLKQIIEYIQEKGVIKKICTVIQKRKEYINFKTN
ncbi:type II toxin-antitoxin system PemK/MazF family toxin [Persicitalea sp.]|uniref:type II toxin-antitoxin system PemK/MazF family toxin n=1 Tax=Persicitalea sp. TaxID=3100273 RepID=UPI0035936E2F